MKVKDLKLDKRRNKEIWIMEYNRDGTIDTRNYSVNNIPINELNRVVMDVYDNDEENYIEIYVI